MQTLHVKTDRRTQLVDVTAQGLSVCEMIEGMTLGDLQALTEPPLTLAEGWRPMQAPAL